MISYLLGIVPWYVWVAAIAVIALITVGNLWPLVFGLVRAARGVWNALPSEAKLGLLAIATLGVLIVLHLWTVRARVNEARAEEVAACTVKVEGVRNTLQQQIQAARDAGQAALDRAAKDLAAVQLARQRERAAAEKRLRDELAKLKEGFASYVSPLQLSRCSDVPRGYLVRRANAAAFANGGADSAGPPASPSLLDEPSGVSLAALDQVDVDAAGAYRACRARVVEWEQWADDVETRIFKPLQAILQPKGVTP